MQNIHFIIILLATKQNYIPKYILAHWEDLINQLKKKKIKKKTHWEKINYYCSMFCTDFTNNFLTLSVYIQK